MTKLMNWKPDWLEIDGEVERVHRPTEEEFASFLQDGKPRILEGELEGTKARRDWSVNYLREKCGDATVRVFISTHGDYSVDIDSTSATRKEVREMSMDEFVARLSGDPSFPPILEKGERYYLYAFPTQLFDGILSELPEPRFLRDQKYGPVRSNFWISQPGFITLAHSDPFHDNLLAQIQGVKRVLLWDPSQAGLLYLNTFGEQNHGRSQPDLLNPDFSRYPLLKQSHAIEVCLNPGDILYMPEAWVHYIYAENLSMSVNYWFALRLGFQKALGDVGEQFKSLRPELRSFYVHMLRLSGSVIDAF